MLFNSYAYLVFLPVVLALYYAVPARFSRHVLLGASLFFYLSWNVGYGLLLLLTLTSTYAAAIAIEDGRGKRRLWLAAGIGVSLLLLFIFKYADFALRLGAGLLSLFRPGTAAPRLGLLLPVGISFYTFQAIGYVVDVYRGQTRAERSFVTYALFVSFFPQLVAGPIERSGHLLSQVRKRRVPSFLEVQEGLLLLLWGYFLKIVVADRLAVFVDTAYGDMDAFPGVYLMVATAFFAFQIYCDFYGYSVIAAGSARLLGIRLMENFKSPYLCSSVAEFWRHWHISLTGWFRDYLYIPLGGNRRGRGRKLVNLLIVFAVSGLWHGAEITFVIWGVLNGLYQIAGEVSAPARRRVRQLLGLPEESLGRRIWGVAVTFVLVCISWVFFRADNLEQAMQAFRSMGTFNPWVLFNGGLAACGLDERSLGLVWACLLVVLGCDLAGRRGIRVREVILAQSWLFRVLFGVLAVTAILLFGLYGPQYHAENFIYFQF